MIMVIKNISRYLMNRLRFGSECMYHMENSMIDHETNRATDRKTIEKKSNFRFSDSFRAPMVIQCQLIVTSSRLELKKEVNGTRLIKNAYLMQEVT